MFGTSQVQNGVIDRDQEIGGLTFESTGQWRLTQVLDDIVFHQFPKLAG